MKERACRESNALKTSASNPIVALWISNPAKFSIVRDRLTFNILLDRFNPSSTPIFPLSALLINSHIQSKGRTDQFGQFRSNDGSFSNDIENVKSDQSCLPIPTLPIYFLILRFCQRITIWTMSFMIYRLTQYELSSSSSQIQSSDNPQSTT